MKWISPKVSSLAMSGAVLFGMALSTIPTTCHAFVVLPSSSSFISERQVVLGSQHNFLSRGAVGAPIMAVSQAAAEETENADEVPKLKDPVSISDFEALDIRVGRIVLAESIPDPEHDKKPSRKYLSLVVDLGNEKRRVVSAIRGIVDVEDAIGKPVLIAANVEEETILGRSSRGRLLSASNFSKQPMPRTLRTVLLGGGGVPPGSAVSGL